LFIEDENIPLILFEDFIEPELGYDLLRYFKTVSNLQPDEYVLYGKKVKSPRLTVFYGTGSYSYSGQKKKGQKFDEVLKSVSTKVEKKLSLPKNYLNGCLLNLYRDGNDSIAYHKDDEKDMSSDTLVVVLSLGAERTFCLKSDEDGTNQKMKLLPNSLVVMNPICQEKFKHSIPKEIKIKEERMSLTFRNFK